MSNALMIGLSAAASHARRLQYGAALGVLLCVLAGCDDARIPDEAYAKLADPRKFHAIAVTAETATVELPLLPDGSGVSPSSYFDVVRFVRRYRQDGKGPLVIAVPPRARHDRAVAENVRTIRRLIAQAGVSGHNVRYQGGHAGVIALSYDRIAAIGPTCGNWSENVLRNPQVLPSPNFGCASQRNLAAMVDNPTDLLYPAQETPRLSERRAAAFQSYINPSQQTDSSVKTK